MKPYLKALIAVLGGVSTWGITAAADNAITQVEVFGLLGVLSTALAVFAFPNAPVEEGDDAGHVDTGGLISLAIGLAIVLILLRVFHVI